MLWDEDENSKNQKTLTHTQTEWERWGFKWIFVHRAIEPKCCSNGRVYIFHFLLLQCDLCLMWFFIDVHCTHSHFQNAVFCPHLDVCIRIIVWVRACECLVDRHDVLIFPHEHRSLTHPLCAPDILLMLNLYIWCLDGVYVYGYGHVNCFLHFELNFCSALNVISSASLLCVCMWMRLAFFALTNS